MPDDAIVTPPNDTPAVDPAPADDPNKGVTPAAARPVIEPASVPKDQRPGIEGLWAEGKAAGLVEGEDKPAEPEPKPAVVEPEPKPAIGPAKTAAETPPTPSAEDIAKLDGKTPEDLAKLAAATPEDLEKVAAAQEAATDAEKAKVELDSLLESYSDPKVLNAALERAGVDKVQELPAVKDLVGRMVQATRDSTRAEIMKAQAQAAQLAEVTAEGKKAKDTLIAALDKLATDIENGIEEGESYAIPDADAIKEAFEAYAGSAVGEYHTKAWNVLSDAVYSLPEMGGQVPEGVKTQPPAFNPEQIALLEAVKGQPPAVWLAAHLAVERDVLWTWAQAEAAANNQGSFEGEKVLLQTAHQREIKDLERKHTADISAAKEEARAEALVDAASGKIPPKTPKGAKPVTTASEGDDGIPAGASISEIRRIVKSRTEAGVEV